MKGKPSEVIVALRRSVLTGVCRAVKHQRQEAPAKSGVLGNAGEAEANPMKGRLNGVYGGGHCGGREVPR